MYELGMLVVNPSPIEIASWGSNSHNKRRSPLDKKMFQQKSWGNGWVQVVNVVGDFPPIHGDSPRFGLPVGLVVPFPDACVAASPWLVGIAGSFIVLLILIITHHFPNIIAHSACSSHKPQRWPKFALFIPWTPRGKVHHQASKLDWKGSWKNFNVAEQNS